MPGLAKRIRYFFEWLALAGTYRLVPMAPRWLLVFLARFLGVLGFYAHSEGRRTAFANLKAAFPNRWTEDEVELLVRKCYGSWAQTYLDQFWTSRLNLENIGSFVNYVGLEEMEKLAGNGGILMTPHYGNFEWMAASLGLHGYHYTAIAQDFKNPRLTPIFRKNREHLGHQLISQDTSMLKLLRVLKKGGIAAFLPDLTVPPGDVATVIRMFGLKVSVTLLGAFLGKRTGRPVLTGVCLPQRDGTYLAMATGFMQFGPEDGEQAIAQACWDSVEGIIARFPEHYLWMYKHFRFRPREEGWKYPVYANRSKKFDRLDARFS